MVAAPLTVEVDEYFAGWLVQLDEPRERRLARRHGDARPSTVTTAWTAPRSWSPTENASSVLGTPASTN
jgi:hypothetical protein